MDIDLAEYDQVDEAKYFMMGHQRGASIDMQQQPQLLAACNADLLTTVSSERAANSIELANCENDYVFLPSPNFSKLDIAASMATANNSRQQQQQQQQGGGTQTMQGAASDKKQGEVAIGNDINTPSTIKLITPDQLDIRSHRSEIRALEAETLITNTKATFLDARSQPFVQARQNSSTIAGLVNVHGSSSSSSTASPGQMFRPSRPLTSINSNSNGGKNSSSSNNNPFFNPLKKAIPDSHQTALTSQACQPFWMRTEHYVSKPIGLIEAPATSASVSNSNHLSDLMHQIITKSDSIFIAIPCLFCHDSKACPPSDISAWLSHMNRTHNCKLCPICNRLVGLGPMRDIEIMRKHVLAHIDDDWLERRSAKTNFSFGLQQQWFPSARCSVKDPIALGLRKN